MIFTYVFHSFYAGVMSSSSKRQMQREIEALKKREKVLLEEIRNLRLDIRVLQDEVIDWKVKAEMAEENLQESMMEVDYLKRIYKHDSQ